MAFRFDKLTIKAQEAVQHAQELAADAGNPQIEPLHLLAALIVQQEGIVLPLLDKMGVNVSQLQQMVEDERGHLPKATGGAQPQLASSLTKILEGAQSEAATMKDEFVSTEQCGLWPSSVACFRTFSTPSPSQTSNLPSS